MDVGAKASTMDTSMVKEMEIAMGKTMAKARRENLAQTLMSDNRSPRAKEMDETWPAGSIDPQHFFHAYALRSAKYHLAQGIRQPDPDRHQT